MIKEGRIDFEDPNGSELVTENYAGKIVTSEWRVIEGVKGIRYREWRYENVSAEIVDGSLFEVVPGCRTPVQYVETNHVFDENIQTGKFLLFLLKADGLKVYKYDSSIEEVSFSLQVHQGEIMCFYALKENKEPGEMIECEQPGFSLANLVTVTEGTTRMGKLEIPEVFWKALKMLDEGTEEDLPLDVFDVSDEI
ncbi:MAG: hypothetical protein UW35_C0015G0011 [Candidatus Collierbacteria bacterium GW2011_GWF2_44_15]|uniref:Uncharacterized protein n=5 Tax=Candidatus Collieribacteriota TaxID=1752725 RepID=A0A0G1HGE6_9BACT|nr:MAG: hypothetical protein UW23_C0019G0022 [Candidatus Collierbacteria bacterium GW2011_GWA1_44_12]KKT37327.1 MAG: hypothetical protein UW26_C0034G0003 [Candidatus Collierbacteria bacterium GW2011_GWF1_44_12]KKT46386.1 MAG: hypothetical protein UW35_C0015G0011 [Candidatus Collierbacteria bacterium GW2011_GWF2_44_15]KKT96983.1 MAG: hypothetical protein UW99_C0043G0006 [Candidatus Collierbacteria bacterium GW2011_GWC2_45_15]KKU29572.1 MAG: hypothetical protein UX41_C0015G0006 [Candidatus Collie